MYIHMVHTIREREANMASDGKLIKRKRKRKRKRRAPKKGKKLREGHLGKKQN